ncbi:MAG: CmpA/NrtA family ABC transporter substrate-binding protein [Verrucomicrobiota bacterium]
MERVGLTKMQHSTRRALRLGFVPLSDCAPLVVAEELGLFAKHGLKVQLSREIGWATLRDKLSYGELEAAHALAPLALSMNLGLGGLRTETVAGLVLNLNGNAITLSKHWLARGVNDSPSLAAYLRKADEPLILGVPFLYSAHYFLLRRWLQSLGITFDKVARLVVVPPPQMPVNLKAGNLDGYCVGEPWNSIAVLARTGWLAATSHDIAPRHPEKILLVRRDFAEKRAEEHEALIAALIEAGRFCADPEQSDMIVRLLAAPRYLNTTEAALRPSFGGVLNCGEVAAARIPGFSIFAGEQVNEPSPDKAAWLVNNLRDSGLCRESAASLGAVAQRCFQSETFRRASSRLDPSTYEHVSSIEAQPTFA